MVESLRAVLVILVQPSQVYPLIRERAPVLVPLLVVAAVGVATGWMAAPHILELSRQQLLEQPELPAEALEMLEGFQFWSTIIGGAVGVLVFPLLTAAILALGILFTGGRLPFRQALSLALLSYGPVLLAGLLTAGMLAAGLVSGLLEAKTSLALILGPDAAGSWSYRILDLVNPFTWWHIALLAGGVRHVGDTSSRTAWILVGVMWLLLHAAPTLLVGIPAA